MSKSKELVAAIKDDHKIIKKLYKEGLKKKASLDQKREIFGDLLKYVTAHSKSEEWAMYTPTCREEETRHEAFEGFEEHGLVELLMEEMKSESNEDRWEAKFTVVCELLEHHIEEEESEYLPKVTQMYSDEERETMGAEYREMYSRLVSAQESISEPTHQEHLRSH